MAERFDALRYDSRPLILVVERLSGPTPSLPDPAFFSRGIDVLRADNPDRGLESAEQRSPDLVLLDLKTSERAEVALLRKIRSRPHTESLPVLVILNDSNPQGRIAALESGADDCLSRPFETNELFGRIEAVLRRTRNLTNHRKAQAHLVTYLVGHYGRRGYEVYSPFLPGVRPAPDGWIGPAPDLTIVRGERTTAVATETVQSLLREATPARWIAFLENDIQGLRVVVRDRESRKIARRIRKALDLPFRIRLVGHRPHQIQPPRLRSFRLRRKQRRAIAIGAAIVGLSFVVGSTQPGGRLQALGTQILTWFIMQARHYQPKNLERELMRQAKEQGGKATGDKKNLEALRRQFRR
ncbi:MAG: response regulator [Candidatus Tectomicrobia bacterium]|nr:response regulator [Candidatus Tectomicrobia bacterium]